MSDHNKGSSLQAKLLFLAVVAVFLIGAVLMYQQLSERQNSPRPQTPERYLSPADSAENPAPSFSEPKVEEKELVP